MTNTMPFGANALSVSELIDQTALSSLSGTCGGRRLERWNFWRERTRKANAWQLIDWSWGRTRVARFGLVPPSLGQTSTFGGRSAERGGPVADMRDLQNRRRLFLIHKKFSSALSATEARELADLQADFEATLDAVRPLPAEMLDELERLAEGLEAEGSSS